MKVDRRRACWLWTAGVNDHGYGMFKLGPRAITASRAAYLLTHGDIPAGLQVCHRCDVRLCVNPDHLFLGTPLENAADCVRKGRQRGHHWTAAQIEALVQRRIRGEELRDLGREFGVSHTAIWKLTRARMKALPRIP
jgi:hypothetical protein